MRPLVIDASALVALLTSDGKAGEAATEACRGAALAAPSLLPYEVANVLRRLELTGAIDATTARLAHRDLLDLRIELWPYEAVAERAWHLRGAITIYEATYVAVAEAIGAPLLTLDGRLSRASGATCEVLVIEA